VLQDGDGYVAMEGAGWFQSYNSSTGEITSTNMSNLTNRVRPVVVMSADFVPQT